MRFQVPQYIEVEDKIFGPLTFKQFIYLAGSVGIGVVLFTLLPRFIAIILGVPVVVFGVALAFFKVNERPFTLVIEDFVKFYIGSRLYIWKKEANKPNDTHSSIEPGKSLEQLSVPKLSGSKLKDLTFELDVKQQSNPVTKDTL